MMASGQGRAMMQSMMQQNAPTESLLLSHSGAMAAVPIANKSSDSVAYEYGELPASSAGNGLIAIDQRSQVSELTDQI